MGLPSLGSPGHSSSSSSEWSPKSATEFNVVTRNRRLNPRAQYAEQQNTSSGPELSMTDDASDDEAVVRAARAIGRQYERAERRREDELNARICLEEKQRREDVAERGRMFLMEFLEAHNRLAELQEEA